MADDEPVTSDRICKYDAVNIKSWTRLKEKGLVQVCMPSTVMYLPFSLYSLTTAFGTLQHA